MTVSETPSRMQAKSSAGFAIPSKLEFEEREIESHSKRPASAQDPDIDASSIALDSPTSAAYDKSWNDLRFSDELYSTDFYLRKVLDPKNLQPNRDILSDFYSRIGLDLDDEATPPPTPALPEKRGYAEFSG